MVNRTMRICPEPDSSRRMEVLNRLIQATVLLAMAVSANPVDASSACRIDSVALRGDWGQAEFSVEVADSPNERSEGLQGRRELGLMQGMLFVFESPGRVSFWMKNTPIALDMLFASSDGVVTKIHREAIPFDTSTIDGGDDTFAVLEINGGLSDRFGITAGSQMRHPAFDQVGAAWPCDGRN